MCEVKSEGRPSSERGLSQLDVGAAGMTSWTRSRPTSEGAAWTLRSRELSSRSVVERTPFMAPWVRICRTSERVSMPWMPMMLCRRRKWSRDSLER